MAHSALAAAGRDSGARLEALLGDPGEAANPAGYRSVLAADRAGVPPAAAERLLDAFGLHHEFVPAGLGGRLTSMAGLVRVMRPVFRRDVALGVGYGTNSFSAAADVWIEGTARQRDWLASVVLGGGRATSAPYETAHANDYVRGRILARRVPGGFVLSGSKRMTSNLGRARALTLFCRTGPGDGPRDHSVLLLDTAELPPARTLMTVRRPAVGLRGGVYGELEFRDCPVPADTLLGAPGTGIETALRSAQISRTVLAATVLGAVDTGLRTAARADRNASPVLAEAFVNLLLFDSLALVATRAVHLLPEETSVYSAAVMYLVPRILATTLYDLSSVLGSRAHAGGGGPAILSKHLRDVPAVALGHAGSLACQAAIIAQLRQLAARSRHGAEPAPATLFDPHGPLPPLRLNAGALALACGRDSLGASLAVIAEEITGGTPTERALGSLAAGMAAELRDLRERVLALPPLDPADRAGPLWFALTDRYTHLLAAAAVVGVWWHARGRGDPFLADPAWAAAALHRLAGDLGLPTPRLPPECWTRIQHEVRARLVDPHSYDLFRVPVAG